MYKCPIGGEDVIEHQEFTTEHASQMTFTHKVRHVLPMKAECVDALVERLSKMRKSENG